MEDIKEQQAKQSQEAPATPTMTVEMAVMPAELYRQVVEILIEDVSRKADLILKMNKSVAIEATEVPVEYAEVN